jgi:sulfite reductase (NADPH) flavoprotein alpha-component
MAKGIQRLHLVLAISVSLVFLPMLVSGVYLAWEPALCHTQSPIESPASKDAPLGVFLRQLEQAFEAIEELRMTPCGDVVVTGTPNDSHFGAWVVNPQTGETLGEVPKRLAISQFMLTLHRSLFLDWTGRVLAGLCSVLTLCLIVAGGALWFKLYGCRIALVGRLHSDAGILSMLPMIVLVGTGVALSAARFEIWEVPRLELTRVDASNSTAVVAISKWGKLENISLSEVKVLRYPFFIDENEALELTLQSGDRMELRATDGALVAESSLGWNGWMFAWTNRVHTARFDGWLAWLWIAISIAMLVLVVTGFRTWLTRLSQMRRMNQSTDSSYMDAEVCIVVASQNGMTAARASRLAKLWAEMGVRCKVVDLASFRPHPKLDRALFLLATYGQGDSPNRHESWRTWVSNYEGNFAGHMAVVAFGDDSYPEFAAFGEDMFRALEALNSPESVRFLGKVNRQDDDEFAKALGILANQWGMAVPNFGGSKKALAEVHLRIVASRKAEDLAWIEMEVLDESPFDLLPESGSLMGFVPSGSTELRWYSISRLAIDRIGIMVKRHNKGVCSNQLHAHLVGDCISGRISPNANFRLPLLRPLIFVANGSGMGPFVGMIQQLENDAGAHLFWGVQTDEQYQLIRPELVRALERGALKSVHATMSREGSGPKYVQDAVGMWSGLSDFANKQGTFMICGSQRMAEQLAEMVATQTNKSRAECISAGTWLEDCY